MSGEHVHVRRRVFALGVMVTLVLPMYIHTYMLTVVGYPHNGGSPGWVRWLDVLIVVQCVILLCRRSPALARRPFLAQMLVVSGLMVLLRECLRVTFLNGLASTAYLYAVLSTLPRFELAIMAALAGLLAFRASDDRRVQFASGLVTGLLALTLMHFVLDGALAHLAEHFRFLEKPDRVASPYPRWFDYTADATFIEPVVAALIICKFTETYRTWRDVAWYALVIMVIRSNLTRTFVDAFFQDISWRTYMPQGSQFLFEGLLLGACASLTWRASLPHASARPLPFIEEEPRR